MPYRLNVLVCTGTHCVSYGSFDIIEALKKELKKRNLESEIAVIPSGCNGFCPHGSIVQVQPEGIFYQKLTLEDIPYLVEEHFLKGRPVKKFMFTPPETKEPIPKMSDIPFFSKQILIALRNRGLIDPEKIEEYIAQDGYKGFTKVITTMTPYEVINEIKESGLRGRGGGGFPTGLKWEVAYKEPSDEKYLIVNCDEGDPGAFMDRSIVESDPHSIVEGMLIGAYALGVKQGFIYVRMEYPLALKRFYKAIEEAKEYGLLGKNILDKGMDFDIEVHQGAGAFICGEETALIRSIQGFAGEAQSKYVYPAQKGLNGKPTIINNVETWANIPQIVLRGAKWFASIGNRSINGSEKGCTGTKVFSLVGKVNNTGLIEVPMGTTLREIIFDIGGGIQNNKKFKAVQTGGPSGGFIPEDLLDLQVDYEELAQAGSMMGSGGMVVLDEDNCMVDMAKYFLDFVQSESCGKCTPCREGTKRMLDILDKISKGEGSEEDLIYLEELAYMIAQSSLCALGGTAPNPVLTTLKYFRDEYEAHVKYKKCPAHACRQLNTYYVDAEKCLEQGHGCGVCKKNCPDNAISGDLKGVHKIDPLICGKCGVCYDLCNFDAIYIE
jgi:NADH:ubiquinone oxidoreductase subunit F (NADH-binding)/(2Fe-2S) ferredoxin